MVAKRQYITPHQYLAWEHEAETKSEYYDGEIVAMAGASPQHDTVAANIAGEVYIQIKGSACRNSTSDMRIGVRACNRYFYPDLSVTCGERQFEQVANVQSLINPTLVVEVLSPSTERVDRCDKLHCYRTLDALLMYVLVSQDKPRIETYTRQPDGAWRYEEIEGLGATLALPAISAQLRLADVYADVTFAAPADLPSEP